MGCIYSNKQSKCYRYGNKLTPASRSIKQTGATIIFAETWDGTEKNDSPSVTWTSSDPSVATVDDKGIVTGIGTGTTDIVAAWNGVQSEPLQIKVTPATDVSVTDTMGRQRRTDRSSGSG